MNLPQNESKEVEKCSREVIRHFPYLLCHHSHCSRPDSLRKLSIEVGQVVINVDDPGPQRGQLVCKLP